MATRVTTTPSESWTADNAGIATTDGAKQLIGRDPFRQNVLILNRSTSAGTLWVRPDTSTTGGIPIAPGAGVRLYTLAAVYGYAVGGSVMADIVSETGGSC